MVSRIDPRPLVRKALIDHFKANTTHAFYTGIGGRLGYVRAVQGWALPYAVFFFVDASEAGTWSGRSDDVLIQFSVWAATADAAESLASSAYGLFENQLLTVTGLAPFRLHRDMPVPTMDESGGETSLWQSGITLAGIVQTTS